jgi:hypothetical protein
VPQPGSGWQHPKQHLLLPNKDNLQVQKNKGPSNQIGSLRIQTNYQAGIQSSNTKPRMKGFLFIMACLSISNTSPMFDLHQS